MSEKFGTFLNLLFELFVLTFCSAASNKCNSTQTRHSMYIEIQTCPVRSYKTFWGVIYSFFYRNSVLYCDRHFYPSLIFADKAWNILKLKGAPLRWTFFLFLKGQKWIEMLVIVNHASLLRLNVNGIAHFWIFIYYRGLHCKGYGN